MPRRGREVIERERRTLRNGNCQNLPVPKADTLQPRISTGPLRLVFGLLATAFFGNGLKAQSCDAFDVASIRLNTSGAGGTNPGLAPGGRRFTAGNQLMVELIMFAYDVSPLQISGIPGAFSQERFDIEATCEQPMTTEQLPRMLQVLLAERFHLSIHREIKEQPVYLLIRGKGGPKFHESLDEGGKPGVRQKGYSFTFTDAAMSNLAGVLSQLTGGRKVLDRTGLGGNYDFTLSYVPDSGDAGRGALSPATDGFPDSVFTALREQLGLDLEAQKSQVEFIVVDRLDRLTPN